jgi:hypothetical protein
MVNHRLLPHQLWKSLICVFPGISLFIISIRLIKYYSSMGYFIWIYNIVFLVDFVLLDIYKIPLGFRFSTELAWIALILKLCVLKIKPLLLKVHILVIDLLVLNFNAVIFTVVLTDAMIL